MSLPDTLNYILEHKQQIYKLQVLSPALGMMGNMRIAKVCRWEGVKTNKERMSKTSDSQCIIQVPYHTPLNKM